MYGAYNKEKGMKSLYKEFSPLVQSQITLHILEKLANSFNVNRENHKEDETVDLKDLIADPKVPLVAYFPLHDRRESNVFEGKWLSWSTMPWVSVCVCVCVCVSFLLSSCL